MRNVKEESASSAYQPLPKSFGFVPGRRIIISKWDIGVESSVFDMVCACNIRFGFNFVDVRDKIHFFRFLGPLLVVESGTEVQDGEQG